MDREKVIECLQKAKMVIETWIPMFEQYNTPAGIDDAIILLKEQEELLHKKQKDIDRLCNEISEWKHKFHDITPKEQEAVEPKKESDGKPEPWTVWWYVCGDCGQPIDKMDRYCRRCGKKVKWK